LELCGVGNAGLAGAMKGGKEELLFLKKKQQKNFCSFRAGIFALLRPKTNKSLLRGRPTWQRPARAFFSKKQPLS
jgi:hypothetical protein